jgi:HlyD family secretion protein
MKLVKMRILLFSVLLLFGCDNSENYKFDGYIEGEFVYIAPTSPGILDVLHVAKGQKIHRGQSLFAMETVNLQAILDQAISKRDNLVKGKRSEEIDVVARQKEQAEADFANAEKAYSRCLLLAKTNAVSQSDLDEKTARRKALQARVQELSAALVVAKMGARSDEINAAHQEVIQAQNNLGKAIPVAKQDGIIMDIYYRSGEFVNAGAPVICFLPFENVKCRFFVSEATLRKIKLNQKVKINLAQEKIDAKITFISPKAEFTPQMIFSVESRKKLVFMVEASPNNFSEHLHPGLPVSISLSSG